MPKANYKLEIDCFSGRPNPVFEIAENDFISLQQDIERLEPAVPEPLFSGLGFRGFILSDSIATVISIQKNIVKIDFRKSVQFKKNKAHILSKLMGLAAGYDKNKSYEQLIEKIAGEYLM